jgi:hypothetical protein
LVNSSWDIQKEKTHESIDYLFTLSLDTIFTIRENDHIRSHKNKIEQSKARYDEFSAREDLESETLRDFYGIVSRYRNTDRWILQDTLRTSW